MTITILTGCCLSILSSLPDQSVHTCVTSPPYWGLRDYGTAQWRGGNPECSHRPDDTPAQRGIASSTLEGHKNHTGHKQEGFKGECPRCGATRKDNQIGLEVSPEEYVAKMVAVFREVRRVLRDDGTLWLNLGDSYAGGKSHSHEGMADLSQQYRGGSKKLTDTPKPERFRPPGLKPKDLVGIPWRVAFALQADGWYLRSDIIWSKPNPMPESVTDRPTKAHEYLFLLSKGERYYYDAEAVKEPMAASSVERLSQDIDSQTGSHRAHAGRKTNGPLKALGARPKGNAKTFRGGGAYTGNRTFDNDAQVERESHGNTPNETGLRNRRTVWEVATVGFAEAHFATYPPKLIEPCILASSPVGGTALDPFFGAGTTGLVADRLGRHCIGIELNPDYVALAERRLRKDAGMLADIVVAA